MRKIFYVALLFQTGIALGAQTTKKELFEIAYCKTIENKLLSEELKKSKSKNTRLLNKIFNLTKELQTQKETHRNKEKAWNDILQTIFLGLEVINKNFEDQEEFKKQLNVLSGLIKKEEGGKK